MTENKAQFTLENHSSQLEETVAVPGFVEEIAEDPTDRYDKRFLNVERRALGHTVFHVDEAAYPSTSPRPSHWSIAWSDLMMTMFILFLSMFTYQAANEEFLVRKTPEIIGGDTTEALQTFDKGPATLPFPPITPGAPLMTGGSVKKVEQIKIDDLRPESAFPEVDISPDEKKQAEFPDIPPARSPEEQLTSPEKIAILVEQEDDIPQPIIAADTVPSPTAEIQEPRPLIPEAPPPRESDSFQEIYSLGQDALTNNKLDKFASIDIVPDKTMRIVLTSDLLFGLGESQLSEQAKRSLQKIGAVIRFTPYMINVVGHTDNIPMRSNRFDSNWELSVARASTVARFLIKVLNMNPNQFVVSGYSSYRPIKPNTTAENRAQNRRVEIIISKRLPQPEQATAENLQ